jgi:hypothetical protein
LEEAAKRLSAMEQLQVSDDGQWLALDDQDAWGEFDEQRFLKELGTAQPSTPGAAAP